MERTLYWNNTEPSETQLNNTEDSRVRSVMKRLRASCQMGIISGFRVTVNSTDATKIDIGAGEGFTGGFFRTSNLKGDYSGENIKLATSYTEITLADYTLNTLNYVSLVYDEIESSPLTERFVPYTSHNTIISESFTVEILTETDWNSLSDNDKELRILVAIVRAAGAGINLSSSDITQVVQPKTHPIVSQPTSITGVEITEVYSSTDYGIAYLKFELSGKKLYWKKPGGSYGAIGVSVTESGGYTVTDADGISYIIVEVTYAELPTSGDITEAISISSLYGASIPVFSAVDRAHRDMVGSGPVTPNNPHGITINDIPGGTFEHAELFHINGISVNANNTQLLCSTNDPANTINIANLGGIHNKFQINGEIFTSINGFTPPSIGTYTFQVGDPTGEYIIYLDINGSPQAQRISNVCWNTFSSALQYVNLVDIKCSAKSASANTIKWYGANKYFTYKAAGDTEGPKVYSRGVNTTFLTKPYGYYKLYSGNLVDYIIIYSDGSNDLGSSTLTETFVNNYYDETTLPEYEILKLYKIGFTTIQTFVNPFDLRRFITSDVRSSFEEEHDITGKHTKVLQNQLSVGVETGPAMYGYANSGIAAYFNGSAYGVIGSAAAGVGGYFSASSIGAYGLGDSGGVFNGTVVDVACLHGTAVPALSFGQTAAGAAGASAGKVYVKVGANTYCLIIYATA